MNEEDAIDRYCAAWNEVDEATRMSILRDATTRNVEYLDPTTAVRGQNALNRHIASVFHRYPNSTIIRLTRVDLHHGLARFGWKKILADGSSLPDSIDVVEFGQSNRIRRIIGFFGAL
jgi:hypothetical protein